MIGRIKIEFQQQPEDGQNFTYRVNKDGIPIEYDNGLDIVDKTFGLGTGDFKTAYIDRCGNDFAHDDTFNAVTGGTRGFDNYVYDVAVSGTSIFVAGDFTTYDGVNKFRFAKLDEDGDIIVQNPFNLNAPGFNANVRTICLSSYPSGTLYVGGDFTTTGAVILNRIAKLSGTTGAVHTAFAQGTGFDGTVIKIEEQPDGKILVGGGFKLYNGTKLNRLCRLEANGNKDTTFNTNLGAGFSDTVREIHIDPSGKIMVGGNFQTYNNSLPSQTNRQYLVRLNANGTYDASFNSGGSGLPLGSAVLSIVREPVNGDYYIGGSFTSYNNIVASGIFKVDQYGAKITSWAPTFNGGVTDIEIDGDGNIRCVGGFTQVNGEQHLRVVTLDPVSATTISNTTNGYNNRINVIKPIGSDDYIVGGQFGGGTTNLSTEYDIPIGADMAETQQNTLYNLETYNTNPNVFYSSIGNIITATFLSTPAEVLTSSDIVDIEDYVHITWETEGQSVVTLLNRPQTFTPVYNPVQFKFLSDSFEKEGFKYIVDLYKTNPNQFIGRFNVAPLVDGSGYIDFSKILSNFVDVDFDPNTNFTADASRSYTQYKVNIGEQYLDNWEFDTVSKYTVAGPYVGNAKLSMEAAPTPHNYVVGDQINVTGVQTGYTFANLVQGLHTVVEVPNLSSVVIEIDYTPNPASLAITGTTAFADNRNTSYLAEYNISGLTVFNGAFTWQDLQNYNDYEFTIDADGMSLPPQYCRFLSDLPDNGMMITPTQDMWMNYRVISADTEYFVAYETNTGASGSTFSISGTGEVRQVVVTPAYLGINGPTLEWYNVWITDAANNQLTKKYRITMDNRCKIEDYEIAFMDRLGSIASFAFPLRAKETNSITREEYKQKIDVAQTTGGFVYNTWDRGSTVTNVDATKQFELTTNWMTDSMSIYFQQLITSPYTWIKMNDGQYYACIVQDKDDEIMRQKNKNLIKKTVTVRLALDNPINI